MHRGTTGGVAQAGCALQWLLFFIHQYFILAEGHICLKLLCLHIAGVIYLFDYCPESWHVPVIDGNCVPGDTGLLLSPVAYSLKDSSAERTVTLCSSALSHPPPPHTFSHHLSFLVLEPHIFSVFAAVWMQMGQVTFCRFNLGKSPAFCVSARAVVQRWKAQTPCVEPELVPCQISQLYPPRVVRPTVPRNRTTDARRGQRTERSREQFVCKWRDLTDEGAVTQKCIQLTLWKMRNRDTIYSWCVASQCLCSCNAS